MDPMLHGECLGGALYTEDFRRLLARCGCLDYRVVSERLLEIDDVELKEKIRPIQFSSITVRAFKIAELEDSCENYGESVCYKGTDSDSPEAFVFDKYNRFEKDSKQKVSGNTALMIQHSRFAQHFTVEGDRSVHFGEYSPDAIASETSEACC